MKFLPTLPPLSFLPLIYVPSVWNAQFPLPSFPFQLDSFYQSRLNLSVFFIGSSPYSINTTFGYARTLAFRVRFHARKNACGVGPRCNINLSLNLECKCLSRSFFPLIYFIIIYQIKLNINVTLTNFGECRTSKENLGLPPTSLPPKKNL